MDSLFQDFRYALRTLRNNPGFTSIAVLCLALGIGVNTTIFSVVNAILIKPFPFVEPDRIVFLEEVQRKKGWDAGISYPNFLDWQAQSTAFTHMAAMTQRSTVLTDGEEPERLLGGVVSWNLFPLLGITPSVGRGFRAEDDRAGAEGVVLLSDELWQRRYNRDPSIVGRSININTLPHTVIGVMPPKFKFPEDQELWVPLAPLSQEDKRSWHSLGVFGRLKPGASVEQARAEITAISKRLATQYPDDIGEWEGAVSPLRKELIPDDEKLIVLTMMGAVSFVLLIACANVANLMLARASARQREMAIRAAIGAGKFRIVRQLLTECVVIALAAGAIGIPIAYLGLNLLDAAIPKSDALPYYIDWEIDRQTLFYTVAVSTLTGILFGLAPAFQAARANLQQTLRDGARGSGTGAGKHRLRSTLVVAEVALSLVLLVGASLFVRSFMKLEHASGGFDTAPLMTMRFFLPGDQYDATGQKTRKVEDIVRRVEALPGVKSASISNLIPLSGGGNFSNIVVEGQAVEKGQEPSVFWTGVTAHFFQTLGVPIITGRNFTEAEASDSLGVAVINQTMAKKLWAGADPLGRRFRFVDDTTQHWYSVIGLIADIKNDDLDDNNAEPPSAVYLSYPYLPARNNGLMVRTAGDPAAITSAVRKEIRSADANLPVFDVLTMEEVRQLGYWQFGLFGWMFSIFGFVALFLAAIGVYGVISYGVTQRTQEIGVRVALGAQSRDVVRLVVGQGVRLAVIGVAIGIGGALAVTGVIRSLLYETSPSDPTSFILVSLFLTAVAMVASYIPARRATGVDPIVALRAD